MAQRLALVPQELIMSQHQMQAPLIRLGQDIDSMLEREKLPDDMKAKLLGELIVKYHKTVHAPREPIPVTMSRDENAERVNEHVDLRDILESTPAKSEKFVPLIVEKLKSREYGWNEVGELVVKNEPVKNSRIADMFSYIFRNLKTQSEPVHFNVFLRAMKEINVPLSWIQNKKVLASLQAAEKDASFEEGPHQSFWPQRKASYRARKSIRRTPTPKKPPFPFGDGDDSDEGSSIRKPSRDSLRRKPLRDPVRWETMSHTS